MVLEVIGFKVVVVYHMYIMVVQIKMQNLVQLIKAPAVVAMISSTATRRQFGSLASARALLRASARARRSSRCQALR